jgi:phage terminase large subunit
LTFIKEFGSKRYFLIEGGRGGGKSQAVARYILYITDKYKVRVVCGREIQNSIKESVYSLFTDLIHQYNLNYQIFSKSIVNRDTGSEINFRGFREQGSFNIQGMEAIDIVWIDESQAITKQTLDVLIPTIRKDTAKIIFTMNRFVRNDPVYASFVNRDDCSHIHLNYNDNPFCTNALKKEALECSKKSEQDYNHIWLGLPLDKTEDSVFTHTEMDKAKLGEYKLRPGYNYKIGGFDIARFGDDKCACVILQQMGALHWEVVYVSQWDKKDETWTCGEIGKLVNQHRLDRAIIDADGLGGPYYDLLSSIERDKPAEKKIYTEFRNPAIGYDKNKDFGNVRTVNTYKLKDLISQGQLCIKDEGLLDELETLRYEYDHNQRRILISKERMKKDGVMSPNMADALIMAVSLVGEVRQAQEQQYRPRESQSDNLFQIAGVR